MYSKTLPISHHLSIDILFTVKTLWIGNVFRLYDSCFVLSLRISHYWITTRVIFTTCQLVKLLKQPNHLTKQNTWAIDGSLVSLPSIQTDGFLKQNQDLNIYLLRVHSSPCETAELNVSYSKHHIYLGLFIFSLHSDWAPFCAVCCRALTASV